MTRNSEKTSQARQVLLFNRKKKQGFKSITMDIITYSA